jgi:tetratricopeptide (TPR) repeat protein
LLKSLADIESQRLNWKEALAAYEEIARLAPDEEESAMALVDLHFRMGNAERGIRALDTYMRYCVTSGHTDRIVTTLEEQVRRHPDEAALRQRLADVYQQQKRFSESIAQMDALGELYLDSGRKAEAIDTIRKIISLNPPDVEGYHQLLAQLES